MAVNTEHSRSAAQYLLKAIAAAEALMALYEVTKLPVAPCQLPTLVEGWLQGAKESQEQIIARDYGEAVLLTALNAMNQLGLSIISVTKAAKEVYFVFAKFESASISVEEIDRYVDEQINNRHSNILPRRRIEEQQSSEQDSSRAFKVYYQLTFDDGVTEWRHTWIEAATEKDAAIGFGKSEFYSERVSAVRIGDYDVDLPIRTGWTPCVYENPTQIITVSGDGVSEMLNDLSVALDGAKCPMSLSASWIHKTDDGYEVRLTLKTPIESTVVCVGAVIGRYLIDPR